MFPPGATGEGQRGLTPAPGAGGRGEGGAALRELGRRSVWSPTRARLPEAEQGGARPPPRMGGHRGGQRETEV